MKKLLLFSWLILVIISCDKDNDDDKTIRGTWIISKIQFFDCQYEEWNITTVYNKNGCNDDGDCQTLLIGEEVVVYRENDEEDEPFLYTLAGSTLTVHLSSDVNQVYTYDFKGDTLILTSDGDPGNCSAISTYKRK